MFVYCPDASWGLEDSTEDDFGIALGRLVSVLYLFCITLFIRLHSDELNSILLNEELNDSFFLLLILSVFSGKICLFNLLLISLLPIKSSCLK